MNAATQQEGATAGQLMPQVPLGPHRISRLILGGNPIGGGSHMSPMLDKQMRRYFTPDRIMALLSDCEEESINLWQAGSGGTSMEMYRKHQEQGGHFHYMAIATGMPTRSDPVGNDASIGRMVEAGGIAISHWGSYTDRAYRAGKIDEVQDFLKKVRDAGMLAGVATHMPEVLAYVMDKDWDVDYYMPCAYNPFRGREEVEALLGHVPEPGTGKEVYLEDDPPRMLKLVQQASKTCLVFKILAAGRRCRDQEMVEETFKQTFSQIKASDAVIVGMYPEWEDQVQLNASYVRRYSDLSK